MSRFALMTPEQKIGIAVGMVFKAASEAPWAGLKLLVGWSLFWVVVRGFANHGFEGAIRAPFAVAGGFFP